MSDEMGRAAGFVTASTPLFTKSRSRQHNICRTLQPGHWRREYPRLQCCAREKFEPVEAGVQLSSLYDAAALDMQCDWIAKTVTNWLDEEWETEDSRAIHKKIGIMTARIYGRQRMEGEHDLSGVLLAIANELQGLDMSKAFVGPFNVANKVAELLLQYCSVGNEQRLQEAVESMSEETKDSVRNIVQDRDIDNEASSLTEADSSKSEVSAESDSNAYANEHVGTEITTDAATTDSSKAIPPVIKQQIERHLFIRDLLEEEIPSNVASGAVACAVGFVFDVQTRTWQGSEVKDSFFKQFGDEPPADIFTNQAILDHLAAKLAEDDDSGEREKSLQMYIETMNGEDITRILREKQDPGFRAREIVAMFLHIFGDY